MALSHISKKILVFSVSDLVSRSTEMSQQLSAVCAVGQCGRSSEVRDGLRFLVLSAAMGF